MSLRRAIHELFSNGLYAEQEQYVQFRPYESFGRTKSYRRKIRRAIAFLGPRYCLSATRPPKPSGKKIVKILGTSAESRCPTCTTNATTT